MSALLFVAADPRECVEWVKHWTSSAPEPLGVHWARAGKWNGRDVVAVANGAGADRAYQAVLSVANIYGSLGAVCSIGFCGALDASLRVGDVVRVSEIRSRGSGAPVADVNREVVNAALTRNLVLESLDHIVATATEKRQLRQSGASVVEMEAAGVARAAAELAIPFYCVRAVSDSADESFANDFEAALQPDGRFSVARLVWGALGSPIARFGELIRLGRRTALASKNLGEFLAHCNF